MAERDNTWNLNVHLHQFPKNTLLKIKQLSDKYNGSKEWLANVYHHPKTNEYVLGAHVEGDYSGVSMKPDEQAVKDKFYTGMVECVDNGIEKESCKRIMNEQIKFNGNTYSAPGKQNFGVTQEDLVATLHLHPIRRGESEHNTKLRSQFSGTDIGSEFAKSIKDDRSYKMFLTYPASKNGRRHNMLKMIVFPGDKSVETMKASNPHLTEQQLMSITPDGQGIEIVDWYAYQDEAKKRGQLEEIDIEKSTGTEAYKSGGRYYIGFAVAAVAVTAGVILYINRRARKKKP